MKVEKQKNTSQKLCLFPSFRAHKQNLVLQNLKTVGKIREDKPLLI